MSKSQKSQYHYLRSFIYSILITHINDSTKYSGKCRIYIEVKPMMKFSKNSITHHEEQVNFKWKK